MTTKNCCGSPEIMSSESCGCCEGVERLTPRSTANRPGLSELAYRIGTHAEFMETMQARLSSHDFPELAKLTTRNENDPSLALLDAWAAVADVLTFYQERIANEGYLRTADERRSILELGRLVGYNMRPGVSASSFLAYTIDENSKEEVVIPAGSRVQSIPGPDELPQTFESSEDLKARSGWNNLRPRMTRPQTAATIDSKNQVYLKGISTNLQFNDRLLIDFDIDNDESPPAKLPPELYCVIKVEPDAAKNKTLVLLKKETEDNQHNATGFQKKQFVIKKLMSSLEQPASLPPTGSKKLLRNTGNTFGLKKFHPKLSKQGATETNHALLKACNLKLRDNFGQSLANARAAPENTITIYALRKKAAPFGHNAPPRAQQVKLVGTGTPRKLINIVEYSEWEIDKPFGDNSSQPDSPHQENKISLDNEYNITKDDWIVIIKPDLTTIITKPTNVVHKSIAAYGQSGSTIEATLQNDINWINNNTELSYIRGVVVYCEPEKLQLAEEPIDTPIGKQEPENGEEVDDRIELDNFYEDLESGRWVIVSGEREIEGTSGVRSSELTMLSSVTQDTKQINGKAGFDEKIHTFIKLAEPLAYAFKRNTVKIHGNVVKATHGETRREVLGSGDGSKGLQAFALKQKPLTHVAASNPTGVDSTLKVFVNDIQWHEAETLADRQPTDRNFITKTDNEDTTSILFGNGKKGARLPTGLENIKAEYRSGIGKPGNVKAEQISLLLDRPLGAKEVINPLRASGGADREGRDQARKNAPLAVRALDRLVSVQDYEDFSRTYAGIGKARAAELSNGRQQLVHVTIAGADDIPIDETSDLYQNLRQALHEFGDPHQPIRLAVRELMLMVVSAGVRILPDYQWEPVVTQLRKTMLDAFSFERREQGQDVLLSEVFSVMQSVRGVAYADIDFFGGIPEKIRGDNEGDERRLLTPDEITYAIECLAKEWSIGDLLTSGEITEAVWCNSYYGSEVPPKKCNSATGEECIAYSECQKFKGEEKIGETTKVRQRLEVNLAAFDNGVIRPAHLAFLTPDVQETLILNQIK